MQEFFIPLEPDNGIGCEGFLLSRNHPKAIELGHPIAIIIGGPNDGMALDRDDRLPEGPKDDILFWLPPLFPASSEVARYVIESKNRNDIIGDFLGY